LSDCLRAALDLDLGGPADFTPPRRLPRAA
jgi:hypothetical protein